MTQQISPEPLRRDTSGRVSRLDELVSAAARVFADRGYERASLQQVADVLGFDKASIYHYVAGKEALLFEVCRDVHAGLTDNVEQTRAEPGTVLDRLRSFVVRHVLLTLRNMPESVVFHRDFDSLSESHRAEILAARNQYAMFVEELVGEGQAVGLIRSDMPARVLAFGTLAAGNYVHRWFRDDHEWSGEAVAGWCADFVIGAIGVASADMTRRVVDAQALGDLLGQLERVVAQLQRYL